MRHVIVGTAGHIDHGKSALVLALTGTDPDRWEEEKRRGITIDLGFAHLDLGEDLRIGFIDVPGHERFVKNMLAGVGGIDLVMLIVAGDESIKPQTREHFDICKLLGIRRGLVVITKSDLVDREVLDLVRLEVQEFVAGSFLAGAPMVAVSARTGEGLDELKNELRRLSLEAPPKPADLPFRLPIDRSFVMKGFGAVVTGTLITGTVEKEAEVEIFPLGKRARVRGIEVYNAPADRATAGQRTALNLAGTEARQITRGMVLAAPGLFQPTTSLDCTLSLLPSARPLKNHAQVHFHCGTAEMLARVVLLEGKEMKPGASGFVQLRLSEPGLFVPGDRFIIRQFSPVTTIGGGGVLDNAPPKHRPGDPATLESLRVLEHGEPEARLELLVQRAGEATPRILRPARAGNLRRFFEWRSRSKPKSAWCSLGNHPACWSMRRTSRDWRSCSWSNSKSFMRQIRWWPDCPKRNCGPSWAPPRTPFPRPHCSTPCCNPWPRKAKSMCRVRWFAWVAVRFNFRGGDRGVRSNRRCL